MSSDWPPTRSSWATGTVITGTAVGFFGQHRHHIRELVNSSGATYSGDLLEGFTTHLVYKDLNAAKCGEKYATALEWGIPVLPFSWLTESAAHQQLLPADAVPRVLTAEGLTCPATKLQMLSLQVEQKEAVPTEQANTKLADLTDMGTVQVGSNQASCRSPQGALSSSGGSACPSVQHLQDAAQLQERSQREAQHGVRLQQQQADDVQWQQCQQEAMQSSTKQQSGHSGYRDASFATRAALCDEHSTSQISIGHVAGHAQAADEHADSALTIPDSVPDEPAELHQTEPVSMPMQPQQLPTSNSMPAEVAAVSHDCTSPLHTSIQISATVAISDSGSETDVSAVPDSQELVDMHTLLMPEAQQTRNDATDDEDTVASPSGLHSSADSNFCILSEPVLIGAALSPAADTTQSAQQTAGAALKRSSATSPHRQPTVAANHTSQMSMPSTMEQHRSPLPKPEPVPHQQMLPQSVCSSSRCSPSTTCAASSLIIEDSDSDGDFQTAQPSRPITGKSSGPLQPATVSQRNPTMSKASTSNCSRLQQAAADSQSGQRQAGRQGVHALKLMLRGPRGTTVKQVHALASLKGVEFAELLQVNDTLLNTKEKKVCALLHLHSESSEQQACCHDQENCSNLSTPVIAEVQALYQLPSGEWWVEYIAFHTVASIQTAAKIGFGQQLVLPVGTHAEKELFHGIVRQHAKVASVQGTVAVRRSKQVGTVSKRGLTGYFWRASFDAEQIQIVTDRPVTDFVQ